MKYLERMKQHDKFIADRYKSIQSVTDGSFRNRVISCENLSNGNEKTTYSDGVVVKKQGAYIQIKRSKNDK